ncbi:MAG: AAA family ATPase [Rhodocyclaceae bacterium]|nr:AAA family ATPase [Rhodocyclaceae bacterium]
MSELCGPPLSPKEAAKQFISTLGPSSEYSLDEYQDADGSPAFWHITAKRLDTCSNVLMGRDGISYHKLAREEYAHFSSLYRTREVARSNVIDPIFFVQDATCAEALRNIGIIATTSPDIPTEWQHNLTAIRGRSIRVWPVSPGEFSERETRIVEGLQRLGCTVSHVNLKKLAIQYGHSVADWLRFNPKTSREEVLALPTKRCRPNAASARQTSSGASVELVRADAIPLQPVRWLWNGWLALGKLHILAGAPGTGKSSIALSLAAALSRGDAWPDGPQSEIGDTLIWSGEDDAGDTLGPRLAACGADRSRVYFVGDTFLKDGSRPFNAGQDMAALRAAAASLPNLRLLILDPIVSAVGSADSHRNAEVRAALAPISEMASALGIAVLGITHFTKGTGGRDPVERVTGSLAFGAVSRVVMATGRVQREDGTEDRYLVRAKSNLGPDDGGINYTLEEVQLEPTLAACRVAWGARVSGDARNLLGEERPNAAPRRATSRASEWLCEILKDGPLRASDVEAAANKAGLSFRTVQRAAQEAGVRVQRAGFGGGSIWDFESRVRLASEDPSVPVGPVGPRDIACVNGANGVNGVNGVNGANGANGANGVNGLNGADEADDSSEQEYMPSKLMH